MNNQANLKKGLLSLTVVVFLFSCTEKKESTTQNDKVTPDSSIVKVEVMALKNVTIDDKYFNQKSKGISALQQSIFDELGLSKLIPAEDLKNSPTTKIKILDTLINNERGKILIIAKESENEHWAWLVKYDASNKIEITKQVFYEDFVEYFSTTFTTIKDDKITITTEAEGEAGKTKQVEKYLFKDGQKLEVMK